MKKIKLNMEKQRNILIVTLVTVFAIIFLFNLFWAPMIFLVYMSYITLNKNKSLTRHEFIGAGAVGGFLFYCVIARMYGMGPGILLLILWAIMFSVLYLFWWRAKKTR